MSATLSAVQSARIVMDQVKDSTVADASVYDSIDLIDAATAIKYAQAFWEVYYDGPLSNPTNEQLAQNYLDQLKQFHFEVLQASRTKPAVTAAAAEANSAARGEAETDLDLPPEN